MPKVTSWLLRALRGRVQLSLQQSHPLGSASQRDTLLCPSPPTPTPCDSPEPQLLGASGCVNGLG